MTDKLIFTSEMFTAPESEPNFMDWAAKIYAIKSCLPTITQDELISINPKIKFSSKEETILLKNFFLEFSKEYRCPNLTLFEIYVVQLRLSFLYDLFKSYEFQVQSEAPSDYKSEINIRSSFLENCIRLSTVLWECRAQSWIAAKLRVFAPKIANHLLGEASIRSGFCSPYIFKDYKELDSYLSDRIDIWTQYLSEKQCDDESID